MEIGYGGNATAQCQSSLQGGIAMPTLEDRLNQRKFQLESSLKDINEALDAIKSNPDVLKILNLISKVNY